MSLSTRIAIPTLVRIKPGALSRLGIYLERFQIRRVTLVQSHGLPDGLLSPVDIGLAASGIEVVERLSIDDHSFAATVERFQNLVGRPQAIVGLGGGKALDVAKYMAFLGKYPYFAAPTSLSNDGFCSPQSSLVLDGKRRSFAASMPFGVVVDTQVCAQAPTILNLSGVGDLAAKFTAVYDWKLAFHRTGEPVDDFAALLSDGSVHAFMARPSFDPVGMRLLATSLMLNGIAMEVCGSSRPASGSEHLISHALDEYAVRPRLHGLQVGVATYLVSLLQGGNTEAIDELFVAVGFWPAIETDPFSMADWLTALKHAPSIKTDYFTILSTQDYLPQAEALLRTEPRLLRCFGDP